ncbi:sensor histidine kinase [Paenibacillus solisilvae]|uniref:histidine kinase n=1 Tax=Paenibacillus solisilvae TaxID=2486751 RepID=A0ABW0VW94_9BACL
MRKVNENGLQERVALADNGDELSQMAGLFNGLMDRVEGSFQQQKRFVEDASHELKTPISIMEGHLSLLDRWGKKDPLVLDESLHIALQQVKRLNGIVKELLDLTRAEAGVLHTIVEAIDIENVIRQTVDSFAFLHPDFVFETDITGWNGVFVRIERQHLEQILLILLDNAVNYSLNRKRISLQGFYHDGQAILRIRDRGMGISETHLPYLFNRFYRVDRARTRERGGTGLGLSIAKRLAENYKGAIAVASKVDEGTTVTVTLPVY